MEPRESVRLMQPYAPPTHGRGTAQRLDFNENTVGCSPVVISAITSALTTNNVAMYPEYGHAIKSMASFLEVDADELTFTNGTDEAIQLLVNTFVDKSDEVVILNPSFAMYRFYAQVAGAHITEVMYSLETDLAFPMDELLNAITDSTKAIFLANPNNPTGRAISIDEIRRILYAAPQALVLIDEAYFEFCEVTAIGLIKEFSNLFVCRTLSKAYGLAGLRCGCLISNQENMSWVRRAQSPYSVNFVAAAAAVAAVEDKQFVTDYVREVLSARSYVVAEFNRLGIRQFHSDANFVLFMVNGDASNIVVALRQSGILIRDRGHEISNCLRVTIGTQAQMKDFIHELEKVL